MSMARTEAFVMGRRSSHSLSLGLLMKWNHVHAMMASSDRLCWLGSSANTMCALGIWNSTALTVPAERAKAPPVTKTISTTDVR